VQQRHPPLPLAELGQVVIERERVFGLQNAAQPPFGLFIGEPGGVAQDVAHQDRPGRRTQDRPSGAVVTRVDLHSGKFGQVQGERIV